MDNKHNSVGSKAHSYQQKGSSDKCYFQPKIKWQDCTFMLAQEIFKSKCNLKSL